jgi:hypothetical protein
MTIKTKNIIAWILTGLLAFAFLVQASPNFLALKCKLKI